jgi:hypothetical protein
VPSYLVSLSLTERFPSGGSLVHTLSSEYEAEQPFDAINRAIASAFAGAEESGTTIVRLFVGVPRERPA